MPVNSTHPEYDAALPAWTRARDVFAGEDAVKAGGEKYLPRLDSQDDDEYLAYKNRASFFNATARTADSLVGLIFRRDPVLKLPDTALGVGKKLTEFCSDVDLLGTSFSAYSKKVVSEIITVGRAGTLVDWADDSQQRVGVVSYSAEQIINWRMERLNGRLVLAVVVLKEVPAALVTDTIPSDTDVFVTLETEQLRVLRLVPGKSGEWFYQVEIWRQTQTASDKRKNRRQEPEWTLFETRIPLRLGRPLSEIPFIFHGSRHSLPAVDKPPLNDIIVVNLDHYRLNADYKHGLHFTALPTAWVSGFDKTSSLRIGSSSAWVSENIGANAGFLEFTGQGLTTFERAMDRAEQLMSALGTRMLNTPKRVGETAAAIELRNNGENSVLSAVSMSVSHSLTQVLRWIYWWNSADTKLDSIDETQVMTQLNTDFTLIGLTFHELTAIVSAWKAGAISQSTMFELFRQGEVLPAGRTNEEEALLLQTETATAT